MHHCGIGSILSAIIYASSHVGMISFAFIPPRVVFLGESPMNVKLSSEIVRTISIKALSISVIS